MLTRLEPSRQTETRSFETKTETVTTTLETETKTKILETGLETTMIVKLLRDRDIHTGCSYRLKT